MWEPSDADRRPLGKRLLWLAVLWLAGVIVVGSVAAVIRFWLT